MATTFRAFMEGGQYATAQALSAGMWQALITAGAALALAIPAHLGHHLLHGRVRAIVRDVEWAGNEVMRYLLIDYREAGVQGLASGGGVGHNPPGGERGAGAGGEGA
jgi:biopolymer transport protein ExbB